MRHTNPWQYQELKFTGPRPYTFSPHILQDFYGFTGLISTFVWSAVLYAFVNFSKCRFTLDMNVKLSSWFFTFHCYNFKIVGTPYYRSQGLRKQFLANTSHLLYVPFLHAMTKNAVIMMMTIIIISNYSILWKPYLKRSCVLKWKWTLIRTWKKYLAVNLRFPARYMVFFFNIGY